MSTVGKGRQANFELLRIVAMAMVVTLHFLSKGGLLKNFSEDFLLQDYAVWLAEAFCTVAVDVYVLISGYFLVTAEFRLRKAFVLWAQVFFYSVGVPAVCLLSGILPAGEVTLDRVETWVLPLLREHYWFATIYLLLYILSPLLGRAVREMKQEQLQIILGLLLVLCSVSKSLLPLDLALDTGGYDLLWFICLYLVAAYLRLYGIPRWFTGKRGAICYVVCALAIYALSMGYRFLYHKTGLLGGFYTGPYQYNHLLCLLASVGLFGAFSAVRIEGERLGRGIGLAASSTFGIYLLHENEAIRNRWPAWLGIGAESAGIGVAVGLAAAVAGWYVLGIVAEWVRQKLFGWVAQKIAAVHTVNVERRK